MGKYEIIGNGKTEYVIICGKEALPSEANAAAELQKYLEKITGVKTPVMTDDAAVTEKEIVIGKTNREKDGDFDRCAMGRDGFVIKTADSKLWIVGEGKRGTLYGVYYFLENYLNCRFFTNEIEKVPTAEAIVLDAGIEDKQKPFFYLRDVACHAFNPPHISAKRNLNVAFWDREIPEEWGGTFRYAKDCGGHSFEWMIPSAANFEKHPEYFVMNEEGKRVPGDLCLSNPDVIKLIVDSAKEWLAEDPTVDAIHISQNDIELPCKCENCRKIYEEEGGSFSGTLIRVVNAVAEAIKDDYPNVIVDTYAYQYTRSMPKKTKLLDNVMISFCTIEGCFSHAHEEGHEIRKRTSRVDGSITPMVQDFKEWAEECKNLCVYDYISNFWHAVMTFPDFEAIRRNMRFYADHGVKAVKMEGWTEEKVEFVELRTYLLSKLLFNPYMTKEEYYGYMDEFLEGVYGPGGKYLRQYIDLAEEMTEDICFNLDWDAYHFYPMPTVTRHEAGDLPTDLTVQMVKNYKDTDWKTYWNWYQDAEENRVSLEGSVLFDKAMEEAETDFQREQLDRIGTQVRYIKSYYYKKKLDLGNESFAAFLADFIAANEKDFDEEEKKNLPEIIREYVYEGLKSEYMAYNEALMNTYIAHGFTYFRPGWAIAEWGPYYFDRVPADWGQGNTQTINL